MSGARRRPARSRGRRAPSGGFESLLPLACLIAAGVLLASELMNTFQLVGGPVASGISLCNLTAADRHHYALAVLATFAIAALIVAVVTGSRPAAVGVAIAGALALLIFGIVDLPKANDVGNISSACDLADQGLDAKAVPQSGFWLELVGALALTLSGIALAALNSDQLKALRPRWLGGGGPQAPAKRASTAADDASDQQLGREAPH